MKINPDGAGLDERRLERITEHIQERYIEAGRIAGAQVAVARHGQVGYFRSFGARDLERGRPVEDDTIFRIYSMTKPITGVALLSLYERGLFALDDRVTRFIPEWRGLKVRERTPDGGERLVDPKREMTVRDLLMHMSGLALPGGQSLQAALSVENHKPGEPFGASFRGPGTYGVTGGSILVRQRVAVLHLVDVNRRMKIVAVVKFPVKFLGEQLADCRLTCTRNAENDYHHSPVTLSFLLPIF